MANTDPTPEALQAEIDRLNSELASRNADANPTPSAADNQNVTPEHGSGIVRETSSGAKVIGAAPDPRGGTAVAYSDGTIKLYSVPPQNDQPAQPWGSVPDGTYVSFFTTDDGNRYHFITEDGTVNDVHNPLQTLPAGVTPPTT